MHERIDEVKRFFESGRSVCPFARSYVDKVRFEYVEDVNALDASRVARFYDDQEKMALTYVFGTDLDSHEKERDRSRDLFRHLFSGLTALEHDISDPQTVAQVKAFLDGAFSPASQINAFLTYKQETMFSIAMNSLYESNHPRWSPYSIVVITRRSDIAAVPQETIHRIRKTSQERMGRSYDADELYIMPDPIQL